MSSYHELTICSSRLGVSLSTDGAQANVWTICTHKNGAERHRTVRYGRLWLRAVEAATTERKARAAVAHA